MNKRRGNLEFKNHTELNCNSTQEQPCFHVRVCTNAGSGSHLAEAIVFSTGIKKNK